jgi:fermentation-respiration switch protein FrsA (DUF1100 family)
MLKPILVALVLAYLALAAIAYLLADRLIFLPPPSSYAPGRLPIVHVATDDGARIAALHLPHPAAAVTLIYSHGNAEDLGHLAEILAAIRDSAGVSVLAFDYRGYGQSTGGPPTTAAATRDLEAVYRYARDELGVPPGRIVLHGRSLGTGPAVELAAREPVAGLIVESGFVSAFRVMTRVPLLPFDRFPNLRHMRDVRAPVLVVHGTRDEVIPFSHGRRLFEAAPEPKQRLWVEGAGHNDLVWEAGGEYWAALREFARVVEAQTAGA